ncbi:MAG: F0F1 ATP synthase subunit gamma [Candidatus Omnitrophota bacterium]|nr:F0F1 ATP synthase subunit gamma [Candidatus Omnitrophota bacterium]
MPILKKIKEDVEFNQQLTNLVDILRGIAASQFRKAKEQKEYFKTFLDSFESFFRIVDLSKPTHPFVTGGPQKMGIIMITSDQGFMGGLNTQVINTALDRRKDNPAELIILGRRGASFLKGMGEEFTFFPGIDEENKYQLLMELRDYVIRQKLEGNVGRVILSYPEPLSFTYQEVKLINILPCTELFEKKQEFVSQAEKVLIESPLGKIIEYLVTMWITHKFYEIFENSKLSEFAARTINLEKSYQQLSQKNKLLRYKYFYNFHRLIDRNMRDIFASAILSKKQEA